MRYKPSATFQGPHAAPHRQWSIIILILLPIILTVVLVLTPFPFSNLAAAAPGTVDAGKMDEPAALHLTDKEKAWLAGHKTIRVAFDGYFPPYSFLDDAGKYEGLAVDMFRVLGERMGITFVPFQKPVWKDLYGAAKRREVDVVATMGKQPEREKWFAFTKPYIFKSLVIMTRRETTDIAGPADLAGRRVAVVKSYQYVKDLITKYPAVQPVYVETMRDGLNAVAVGKADAAITFIGAGHYLKNKYHLANLKFAAVYARDRFVECIGVRGDWPELAAIFDKALASITDLEKEKIDRRWLGPEITPGIDYRTVLSYLAVILGAVILLVAGFLTWNRSLRRQVAVKTRELQKELSARQKAQEALQISEERFRHYFERANIGFALTSPEKRWVRINQRLCEMFGYTEAEFLNQTWAEMTYPDDLAPDLKLFNRLLGGEIDTYDMDKRFIRKDKTLLYTHLTVSAIRKADGRLHLVAATLEDISERKKLEESLQEQQENLEVLVQERTAELNEAQKALLNLLEDVTESKKALEKANEKLKELDRLKSMFIASMSHELRTPLNSIIGFTGIILQGMSGEINEEIEDQLQRVYRSGKHLLSLINDVIDISKIEAGKIDVYAEDFDVNDVINETVSILGTDIKDKGLKLEVDCSENLIIKTDRKRLLQSLINYVGNAVKYTEKGKIQILVREIDDMLEISVTDTGIGIKEKDLPTLFQPFIRADSPLKTKIPGTGLGLYLTKKIVTEMLGGEVFVESREGVGSTFGMRVPKDLPEIKG